MPIYAYRCDSCGVEKDVLQKISDAPLAVCPACGAATFHKRLSAPAFQLKGSGWYVTDFRDGGKKTTAEPGPDAAGKADAAPAGEPRAGESAKAGEPGKPEAKPAATPAAGSASSVSPGTTADRKPAA